MRRNGKRHGGDTQGQIQFQVIAETAPGTQIRLVGSIDALGRWQPDAGLTLSTNPGAYPKWSVSASLPPQPPGSCIEYKFIKYSPDGTVYWEEGDKPRQLAPSGSPPPLVRFGEEVPVAQPQDNKPQGQLRRGGFGSGNSNSNSHGNLNGNGNMGKSPKANKKAGGLARNGGHMRCKSMSSPNLVAMEEAELKSDTPLPNTTSPAMGRRTTMPAKFEGGSVDPDQCIAIIVESSASDVLVVFEAEGVTKRLFREGKSSENTSSRWSVPFDELGLKRGFHAFHFLVDGSRRLSTQHAVRSHSNYAVFNNEIRKYILSTAGEEAAPEPDAWRRRAASNWEDGVPKHKSFGRAHSIGTNLGGLGDPIWGSEDSAQDELGKIGLTCLPTDFPSEVFEGLFDRELRLRLHGFGAVEMLAERGQQSSLCFVPGAWQLQKPCAPECEDAYFIGNRGLGVADGVGGMQAFRSWGVNSAHYSRQLMACAEMSVTQGALGLDASQRALHACVAAEENAQGFGASTLGVIVLEGSTLGAANLGDSGFMVLRQGPAGMAIVYKSEEQQHAWNFPYQLMRLPPALAKKYPSIRHDHASDCDVYTHEVNTGDLVLMFSDGLRDNLHDAEILEVANRALSPAFAELLGVSEYATPPTKIAKALALAAQYRSSDQLAKVPFYYYSKKHGYESLGGKEDDITVVAAWVVADTNS